MRRAAVSIPSNIVEGCARNGVAEYVHFLYQAFASLRELRYQCTLAHRLGYFSAEDGYRHLDDDLEKLEATLGKLIQSLQAVSRKP